MDVQFMDTVPESNAHLLSFYNPAKKFELRALM